MNPTPEEEREALVEPKPVGEASSAYLTVLAQNQRRGEEVDRLRDELRALHEKHAAILMEMQSAIRRFKQTAEVQTVDATAARGQAAVMARSLRKCLGHMIDNARSAGWGGLPEEQERDREEANALLNQYHKETD